MRTSSIVWTSVILVILLIGFVYVLSRSSSSTYTAPSSALGTKNSTGQSNTGEQNVTPVLSVAHSATLGDYLVAANGMTLYLYTKDTKNVTNCYGGCAVAWPPYTHTVAEPLVTASNVTGTTATITRTDGSAQITYNGVPLYFWQSDSKPGDTTGQNVGGVWFVVHP